MPDVRKTAMQNINDNSDTDGGGGKPVLANVTGISLSTLIKNIFGPLNMSNPYIMKQTYMKKQRQNLMRQRQQQEQQQQGSTISYHAYPKLPPSASLIIKMDVEGAEYSICKLHVFCGKIGRVQ